MSKLIDSPFEICSVCDQYVFLDQTYEQCAHEHHCENIKCPLKQYFVGRQPPKSNAEDTGTGGGEQR
jgi:hypothetical protein